MSNFLGIDTSNYTTSVALFDSDTKKVKQSKLMLSVKQGKKGLRQSNVVFEHIKQLPLVLGNLLKDNPKLDGIGVSVRPRNVNNSYMPCFLCGEKFADSISIVNNIPVYKTSHQVGHMLAALYSSDKLEYINQNVIMFHVSGGTTECLLCEPDKENVYRFTLIGSSLDLKAGQLIDRVGVMLGLKFPCGAELEKLAEQSKAEFNIKPTIKGMDCCLSGVENICKKMFNGGEDPEDIAKYCLTYVCKAIEMITALALEKYKDVPVVFAGGVMSNKLIKANLIKRFSNLYFASPEFSCDNAVGTAIYAFLMNNRGNLW